jgi:predicted NAD/FAD-binding protein
MPARLRYNLIMSARLDSRWPIATVIAVLCLMDSPGSLTRAQGQGSNFDLEGKITQQSKGKLTVDSGQGILFHVTYDDTTSMVREDSTAGSEQDLKIGERVHVLGELEDSGEIKAKRIEIEGRPANHPRAPA